MKRILHISGDYPDSVNAGKTQVVRTLVDLVSGEFDHSVVSMNRIAPGPIFVIELAIHPLRPRLQAQFQTDPDGICAMTYRAPARGLYHRTMLEQVADSIGELITRRPRPDLILGYKLTIEGIVAARIARQLGVPYGLVIQGNTDARILSARPDLRTGYREIFHGAEVVFGFAPWAIRAAEARLGRRDRPTILLPCPTDREQILPPRIVGPRLATAFHLRNYRMKNAERLIAAVRIARQEIPDLQLDIIGGGTPQEVSAVQGLLRGDTAVRLEGPAKGAEIQARFNRAGGFAMPSTRESFGLVFVEALLAGSPILYPENAAVDGYFDSEQFAIRADPSSTHSIAEGLVRLARQERDLKASLAAWQSSERPRQFMRHHIAQVFSRGLQAALTPSRQDTIIQEARI